MKKKFEDITENLKEWAENFIKENKSVLIKAAAAVSIIAVAFFAFYSDDSDKAGLPEEPAAIAETEEASVIYVDIGGAVSSPMVAELKEGSRVEDAIAAAGGLLENADISQINRAAYLEDGEKIFVPYAEEYYAEAEGTAEIPGYYDGKVNINTADSEELQELNGVGPVIAENIINYREENGRFKSIDDIKNVSGIGDKIFEKLKDEIVT